MKIKIINAKITDLRQIKKLNLLLFELEYKNFDNTLNCNWTFGKVGTKYYQDRILKDNGCVLVARNNRKIVGYLAGFVFQKNPCRNVKKFSELENMYVLKEYRGKGVGTGLCNEFIKWCKNKQAEIIRVSASAKNTRAINFYKNNNFKDYELHLEKRI